MTLVPAYGRDYKSKKEVLAAWEAGKDFTVAGIGGSGAINLEDARTAGLGQVTIRYKRLTMACIIRVK